MDKDSRNDTVTIIAGFFFACVVVLGMFGVLKSQHWLENPTKLVPVPSPVVKYRTEYVASPYPTPVVRTRTQTVTASAAPQAQPSPTTSEGCIEALRAADQLAQAVEQDKDPTAAAANYAAYRSVCKD